MSLLKGRPRAPEPRTLNRDGKDILNVLYRVWRDEKKGQTILGCWIGGLVIASIWGIYIKRKTKLSNARDEPQRPTKKQPSTFMLMKIQENSDKLNDLNNLDRNLSSVSNVSTVSMVSNDDDTPTDENDKESKKLSSMLNNAFKTFKYVFDLGVPSIISSPILWSSLLLTALIYKTRRISAVNDSIGYMGELVVTKKWNKLSLSTQDFAINTVNAAFAIATVNFLKSLLSLSLRDNIISSISCKINNISSNNGKLSHLYNVINDVSMDSIDNRITSDVIEWCSTYSVCFISFCKPIIDVSIYSNKLSSRIGIYYFSQCIFYFFISSMWTRSILPSMSSMKGTLLKNESRFKDNHKRLIDYCEEIHFLRGINAEMKIINDSYESLYSKLCSITIYDYIYEFCHNYIVRYLGILASFISLLPMIENENQPTEFLLNNLHDLVNIGLAFRDLMRSTKEFQSLKGISNRIMTLDYKLEKQLNFYNNFNYKIDGIYDDDVMDDDDDNDDNDYNKSNNNDIYKDDIDIYDDIKIQSESNNNNVIQSNINIKSTTSSSLSSFGSVISFKNVTITTPDNSKILLNKFNFDIRLGRNLLIIGPNGAGKSSLLRIISGLWKIKKGKMIFKQKRIKQNDIYFLPQRSYLIPNLSIKQQILYPNCFNNNNNDDDNDNNNNVSDELIMEIISDCGLGKLLNYLDINDNIHITDTFWNNLSGGEKQLISICRVLIKKPKLLFIDESLSNLSNDKIIWFYDKLSQYDITTVTVTHNINHQIKSFHETILNISGDGKGSYEIQN